MATWEQYEIWGLNGEKWEMQASFHDFDVASAVARARGARVRLIHAVYEEDRRVKEDLLAELGATREHP
jgi:hypothetical protein